MWWGNNIKLELISRIKSLHIVFRIIVQTIDKFLPAWSDPMRGVKKGDRSLFVTAKATIER
jgi:hypothetical protein